MGTEARPDDVAGAVAYLAEAPYVTGQTLVVCGGRSIGDPYTAGLTPETMTHLSDGPLAGIKVVEFAGLGPGPFGAMILADPGPTWCRRPGAWAATAPPTRCGGARSWPST